MRRFLAGEELLGEPDGAVGKRPAQLDEPVHRADQLEAAAADIGDEGLGVVEPEVMLDRAVGKLGFVLGRDDLQGEAELLTDPPDELRAILRFPDGGGGYCGDPSGPAAAADVRHPPERGQRAVHGGRVEAPRAREPLREPGLRLDLVDRHQARRRVVLGDQQPDRVRPDVDGGQSLPGGRARPLHRCGAPAGQAASPRSSAWCLMDLPSTRNTTSSPMLVARSATRSRFRLTRKSSMPAPIMCWILHHVGQQDAEHRPVKDIHLVVPTTHLAPRLCVAPDERLEGVGEHVAGEPRHLDDLGLRRDATEARQPAGRLGDVDRVVAHPLEVVRDLERGGQHPEVPCHRLLEGQQVDAHLLELDLHLVDDPVAGDDTLGLGAVALEERLDGQSQGGLRLTRHRQEADLDLAQVVVKVPVGLGHPNLPVMYASVRSCAGAVKSCSVSPNSMSSPRSKKPVKSDTRAACCMLCVTIAMV